jgi:hypothetical protein
MSVIMIAGASSPLNEWIEQNEMALSTIFLLAGINVKPSHSF